MKYKKKKDIVYDNFLKSLSDVRKLKPYILVSSLLFLSITVLGFLFPIFFEDNIIKIIEELMKKTESLNTIELMSFIIYNNISNSFIGMLLGIFLTLPTLFVLVLNGYVLGFVASKSVETEGFLILGRLLPHGIFEIPAIFISTAIGIKLGFLLIFNCIKKYTKNPIKNSYVLVPLSIITVIISFPIYLVITLMNNELRKEFIKNLMNALKIFLLIIIPLLVIAGIIEGILISVIS
ncbi:stage II sporulation protein M [Candidatus Pacearchaeota archaeon]|nr:stage II sporulation protein M [Candidatus Pacearchaeota archaeon]